MAQRRAGQYPASWGSRGAAATPSSCEATSAMGTYAAATAAGAPAVSDACTVQVTFVVNASTTFGQNVYVSGNVPALGNCAYNFELKSCPQMLIRPMQGRLTLSQWLHPIIVCSFQVMRKVVMSCTDYCYSALVRHHGPVSQHCRILQVRPSEHCRLHVRGPEPDSQYWTLR